MVSKILQNVIIFTICNFFIQEIQVTSSNPPSSDNEVVPLLPMDAEKDAKAKTAGGGYDKFAVTGDVRKQKNQLEFRLANRLAVAVCDTYDNYLATGKPFTGQINYNVTVQMIRSPVPLSTCQSFKIKRCYDKPTDSANSDCGWTKVLTC